MSIPEERSQQQIFTIGADIQCLDKPCGKLHKLVIDPETGKTTQLIVQRGFLKKDRRILPLDVVRDTSPDEIHVDIQSEEFDEYPTYELQVFEEPVEGFSAPGGAGASALGSGAAASPPTRRRHVHQGVPDEHTPIKKGTAVRILDKKLGSVERVLVDEETNEISHLIVSERGLFSGTYALPGDCIRFVDERGVQIDLGGKKISSFPAYETD